MLGAGASLVWRCHIGMDAPDELARSAAAFLLPFVSRAAAYVFSRERRSSGRSSKRTRVKVIAPSIDPLATKNQELAPAAVRAILGRDGARRRGAGRAAGVPRGRRQPGHVARAREIIEAGARPRRTPRWSPRSRAGIAQGPARA